MVKIWDYQTKACVHTLEGHTNNVSAACFHPELPVILTGSEDGTLRIWHANTYRLENILNYSMERLWSLGYVKGSNRWRPSNNPPFLPSSPRPLLLSSACAVNLLPLMTHRRLAACRIP